MENTVYNHKKRLRYLEIWIVFQEIVPTTIFPILILELDIVPDDFRVSTFGAFFLVAIISIFANKLRFEDLGICTSNLRLALNTFVPQALIIATFTVVIFSVFGVGNYITPQVKNNLSAFQYIGLSIPIQQFIYFGYLHPRLLILTKNRVILSLIMGCLFGAMHIPWHSLGLTIATTLLGVWWGYLYSNRPNLFAAIISHEILGITVLLFF